MKEITSYIHFDSIKETLSDYRNEFILRNLEEIRYVYECVDEVIDYIHLLKEE